MWQTAIALTAAALAGLASACRGENGAWPCGRDGPGTASAASATSPERARALRDDALVRAKVWRAPELPIGEADLREGPAAPDGFRSTDEVSCTFVPRSSGGRTPKFHCVTASGDTLKLKYGRANRERQAEVAGTRLAAALGFGADRMYVLRRVRCQGCPPYPFPWLSWLDSLLADERRLTDFDHPVVERAFAGREIRAGDVSGWTWDELDRVDAARGGATRAELDALRLLAAFLAHWDSKAENQRLVCRPGGEAKDGSCAQPFALIADFGATFGPYRADLQGWTSHPVWHDAVSCLVSMRDMPYKGATFSDRRISEGGRRLLVGLLAQLRPAQVRDLFAGARFDETGPGATGGDVAAWVRAFEDRARQIADRGPCPEP